MYFYSEEKPTPELRWNTYNSFSQPRLQQKWVCRNGNDHWTEWRDVLKVEERQGIKTSISNMTMD